MGGDLSLLLKLLRKIFLTFASYGGIHRRNERRPWRVMRPNDPKSIARCGLRPGSILPAIAPAVRAIIASVGWLTERANSAVGSASMVTIIVDRQRCMRRFLTTLTSAWGGPAIPSAK